MSESSELNIDGNTFTLTNREFNSLLQKVNGANFEKDIGLKLFNLGLAYHPNYMRDDFIHLFDIVDEKKLSYARIKYEF
jgi:hypothetical protein